MQYIFILHSECTLHNYRRLRSASQFYKYTQEEYHFHTFHDRKKLFYFTQNIKLSFLM